MIGVVLWTLAWGGISAAPWLPTRRRDFQRLLDLAELKPGEKVYDLGAGDGRVLLAAIRAYSITAVGYEISILQYVVGYVKILLSGKYKQVKLIYGSLYRADLSTADVIILFLTPRGLAKLAPKLTAELRPGVRILTYVFPLPNWQPELVDKPNSKTVPIYRYRR